MVARGLILLVLATGCANILGIHDRGPNGGDDDVVVPSCSGLPATCGPMMNESCCATTQIPGGTFFRDYDARPFGDMSYPATISPFVLDRFEVTVGRFRAFVEAGFGTKLMPPATEAGAHAAIMGSGWTPLWSGALRATTDELRGSVESTTLGCSMTQLVLDKENLPVTCPTWYEAFAFCIWDGGYLPTEAEWNFAASGGGDQRVYPWSDPPESVTIDDTYAVFRGTAIAIAEVGSKSPVGDGKYGNADLAGNVVEWTLDWGDPPPMMCVDCAMITGNNNRVLRGGGWGSNAISVAAAKRTSYIAPQNRGGDMGFRCARAH